MKNHSIHIQLLMLIFTIFLASCEMSESNDPIILDKQYVNQQILLRAPTYGNTFKTSTPILLELKYNSNNEITFPNDFNIQIFQKTSDEWIEIKEFPTTRLPADDIVFSPQKYMPAVQVVYFYPDLADLDQEYFLRVYVFGIMQVEGEIIEVGAFTDVNLFP